MGSVSLIVLAIAAIAFSAGGILAGKFLTRSSTNPQKGQPEGLKGSSSDP